MGAIVGRCVSRPFSRSCVVMVGLSGWPLYEIVDVDDNAYVGDDVESRWPLLSLSTDPVTS